MVNNPIGVYIHVPFCVSKCSYCSFYSLTQNDELMNDYTAKLVSEIYRWGRVLNAPPADTLYFGGGTPSLLNHKQIKAIIDAVKDVFSLKNAEITLEANPAEDLSEFFLKVAEAGVNRVSFGLQSAVQSELKQLSRRHTAEDVTNSVLAAKKAGINNISLDLMLGIPNQTKDTLKQSVDFALKQGVEHISTYLLSLEENTPLYQNRKNFKLPDEDESSELYLETCRLLKDAGFERYEISNFAKNGKTSRHNTKYWLGEEYLGLGPAAHSFLAGKRFFYKDSLMDYLAQPKEEYDGDGGGLSEFMMLRLRLKNGLSLNELQSRFKNDITPQMIEGIKQKANLFNKKGLLEFDGDIISFTDEGALLSNSIICEFVDCV